MLGRGRFLLPYIIVRHLHPLHLRIPEIFALPIDKCSVCPIRQYNREQYLPRRRQAAIPPRQLHPSILQYLGDCPLYLHEGILCLAESTAESCLAGYD